MGKSIHAAPRDGKVAAQVTDDGEHLVIRVPRRVLAPPGDQDESRGQDLALALRALCSIADACTALASPAASAAQVHRAQALAEALFKETERFAPATLARMQLVDLVERHAPAEPSSAASVEHIAYAVGMSFRETWPAFAATLDVRTLANAIAARAQLNAWEHKPKRGRGRPPAFWAPMLEVFKSWETAVESLKDPPRMIRPPETTRAQRASHRRTLPRATSRFEQLGGGFDDEQTLRRQYKAWKASRPR